MKVNLQVPCRLCNNVVKFSIYREDFYKWRSGMNIQDAMPYLTPDEREMLISRTCPVCWDNMWKEEENDC